MAAEKLLTRQGAWPSRADLRAMFQLAAPVVVVQVGLVAMGTVDTMVVGRLSSTALAAVALGNLYFFSICAFGMGTLLAIDPVVAQAVGAGDEEAVPTAVRRGLALAGLLSVPTSLLLLPGELLLRALGQPAEVIPAAADYARACAPGVPAFFAFFVLRQTLQARQRLRPVVSAILVTNLVNLGLDWALVFGIEGVLPGLGAVGAGWASTACRFLLAAWLLVVLGREIPLWSRVRAHLAWRPLLSLLRLGAPIGAQYQLEFAAFGVIALLMGLLGTVEMAAHQVALNLASLTFMVPLGISAAAAVKVGHAVGAGDQLRVKRATTAALLCGGGFMAASAVTLLAIPHSLAAAYTDVAEVAALAAKLIPIAGFFQVFDGLQVVSIGVLRGTADTRAPMVINVLGFWLLGMPASLLLGFVWGLGPTGLWWGLVVGLAAVALLLLARVGWRLGRRLERLQLD